jgi:Trypsin
VFNGSPVNRGAWPWLTAIFVTTNTGLEFQCGGTLISQNHIITGPFSFISDYFSKRDSMITLFAAAHCVMQQTNKMVKPEALLIYLGKHDLFNWNEQEAQSKDVSPIWISVSKYYYIILLFCRFRASWFTPSMTSVGPTRETTLLCYF